MNPAFFTAPTTLYRLYNAAGDLLYVGISVDWHKRKGEHRNEKLWWPEVANERLVEYPCRIDAAIAERDTIIAELPRYNIMHHPDGHATKGVHPHAHRPKPEPALNPKQAAELIAYIKALNITREEAHQVVRDTLTDMGVLRWPRGVLTEEVAEARAAQARRIARGASDPLPQGAV